MDAKLSGECSTEVGGKPGVPITDDFRWESKPSIYVIHIQLGDAEACDVGSTREKYGCPGASMIDYGENGVLSVVLRESGD